MKSLCRKLTAFGLLLFLLPACVANKGMTLPAALPDSLASADVESDKGDISGLSAPAPVVLDVKRVPVVRHKIDVPRNLNVLEFPKEDVMINADGLPLERFIDLALGEVLGLNYEVDPLLASNVSPVTLRVKKPVHAARLFEMIESTLSLRRIGLIVKDGGVQVVPIARLGTVAPSLNKALGLSKHGRQIGRVVEFIPLYYVKSTEAVALARLFIDRQQGDEVRYVQALNALMLIARSENIKLFRNAIAVIDRPSLSGIHLQVVSPMYWKASPLIANVRKLLQAQGVPVVATSLKRNHGVFMFSIDGLNAMVVVSPQKTWLKSVLDIVHDLDVPQAAGSGKQTFVYFVKNSRADDLGNVISQILGQGGAAAVSSKPGGKTISAVQRIDGLKGLSVIIDAKRNALVFVGEAVAYQSVLTILKTLDRMPRQVMLEVTVAEVTLDASAKLGVEWQLNNVDHSSQLTGTLGTLGGLGAGGGGLTYALVNGVGKLKAQLSALASDGKTKILSSPKILALDGEPAKIQVGDQVPVVSQEATSTATGGVGAGVGVVRTFNYIDTGVILDITPTINEGGMVRIQLSQEVSEAGQATTGGNPPIFKRSVNTTLVAQSGQTVVIGGMIRHTTTKRSIKVPFLGDIPWLGALFSSDSDADRSTELIIMITPHVIDDANDAKFISDAIQQQLGWEFE